MGWQELALPVVPSMTFYKVIAADGSPVHGGRGTWSLPTDTEPGEWWEVEGDIVPCHSGLHITDLENLDTWAQQQGDHLIYRAEVEGDVIDHGNKFVARKMRLLPGPSTVAEFWAARRPSVPAIRNTPTSADLYLSHLELPKGHVLTHKVTSAKAKVDDYQKRRVASERRFYAKAAKGLVAWAARHA